MGGISDSTSDSKDDFGAKKNSFVRNFSAILRFCRNWVACVQCSGEKRT